MLVLVPTSYARWAFSAVKRFRRHQEQLTRQQDLERLAAKVKTEGLFTPVRFTRRSELTHRGT